MKSLLATLAFFLPTLAFASVGLYSTDPPLGSIVNRGALVIPRPQDTRQRPEHPN